jgi:uncharacterized membrane protein
MLAKVFFTGFAAAALVMAQGMGGGGGQGGPPGGTGGGGNMGGGGGNMGGGSMGSHQPKESKADLMANRLKLTKDQRSEFDTILESTKKDADPIIQQVLKSRQTVANAMLNNKSEADIAPLVQALSDAQFQMTGVEVKTFQRIVALLKPNQVAKAPEAFDLMADIFLPQGGGRGRGR